MAKKMAKIDQGKIHQSDISEIQFIFSSYENKKLNGQPLGGFSKL
jgi:hypothetical protein